MVLLYITICSYLARSQWTKKGIFHSFCNNNWYFFFMTEKMDISFFFIPYNQYFIYMFEMDISFFITLTKVFFVRIVVGRRNISNWFSDEWLGLMILSFIPRDIRAPVIFKVSKYSKKSILNNIWNHAHLKEWEKYKNMLLSKWTSFLQCCIFFLKWKDLLEILIMYINIRPKDDIRMSLFMIIANLLNPVSKIEIKMC